MGPGFDTAERCICGLGAEAELNFAMRLVSEDAHVDNQGTQTKHEEHHTIQSCQDWNTQKNSNARGFHHLSHPRALRTERLLSAQRLREAEGS